MYTLVSNHPDLTCELAGAIHSADLVPTDFTATRAIADL